MKRLLWMLLLCTSLSASSYQTGKLLSITDSRSNRLVSNSQTGSVVSVTDVEYRLSVQIGDMVYVGSYWPRWRWSYDPTDFVENGPVEVRLDGKHMYIKRPGGKDLKTEIIRRVHADANDKH
jgi:hypothetical protein